MAEHNRQEKLKRVAEYNKDPKRCECCNTPIPYEKRNAQKYCSRSCSVTMNNRNFVRNGTKRVEKSCKLCGKPTKNKVFCSNSCQGQYSRQETWVAIEKETWINKEGRNNRPIRDYLISHRGHKCECCGLEDWQGEKIPITVHHIDGDATNNSLENVELRCWNCHALTGNFGSKNSKSTRTYRYQKS